MAVSGWHVKQNWSQVAPSRSRLAQVSSKLDPVGPMLAPSWLPLKNIRTVACPTSQVGLMLAPCWLLLGSCWLMLDHVRSRWLQVGPSWPQDAFMLAHIGIKMPKMASKGPTWLNF